MASKGQKFRKYSNEFKTEILNKYLSKQGSYSTLASEYGISAETLKTWVYKHNHGIDICVDHRPLYSGNRKKDKSTETKAKSTAKKKEKKEKTTKSSKKKSK